MEIFGRLWKEILKQWDVISPAVTAIEVVDVESLGGILSTRFGRSSEAQRS